MHIDEFCFSHWNNIAAVSLSASNRSSCAAEISSLPIFERCLAVVLHPIQWDSHTTSKHTMICRKNFLLYFIFFLYAVSFAVFFVSAPVAAGVFVVVSIAMVIVVETRGHRWQWIPAYVAHAFQVVAAALLFVWLSRQGALGVRSGVTSLTNKAHLAIVFGLLCLSLILWMVSVVLCILLPVFELPVPSGPYEVSFRDFQLTDGSRPAWTRPWQYDDTHPRRLHTRFWYPTDLLAHKRQPPQQQAAAVPTSRPADQPSGAGSIDEVGQGPVSSTNRGIGPGDFIGDTASEQGSAAALCAPLLPDPAQPAGSRTATGADARESHCSAACCECVPDADPDAGSTEVSREGVDGMATQHQPTVSKACYYVQAHIRMAQLASMASMPVFILSHLHHVRSNSWQLGLNTKRQRRLPDVLRRCSKGLGRLAAGRLLWKFRGQQKLAGKTTSAAAAAVAASSSSAAAESSAAATATADACDASQNYVACAAKYILEEQACEESTLFGKAEPCDTNVSAVASAAAEEALPRPSCPDADSALLAPSALRVHPERKQYPVLLYSHGYMGSLDINTALLEDLASQVRDSAYLHIRCRNLFGEE